MIFFVQFLAKLVKQDGLDLICVPTSLQVGIKGYIIMISFYILLGS